MSHEESTGDRLIFWFVVILSSCSIVFVVVLTVLAIHKLLEIW